MIAVIWAKSPHDGVHHAFPVEAMAHAAERGYAEARCSHTVPSEGLGRVAAPTIPLCAVCAYTVGEELADAGGDPGRLGTY
ncbi:MAG: hypothetical protein ACR2FQ_05325 [Pseudonocardiaceae bacterium]